ncbi:uncharacterized protein V1518DRAFT_414279 [Limtongia smithiae]|uniref:uncharacterized protein n=1 Tax=Limtongia smithiae TaxID=1125753 RepID=UPI0034CEE6F8
MGIFSKKSSTATADPTDYQLSAAEASRAKANASNMRDPILSAMNEEQPFQISNHRGDATVSPEMHIRDMFGNAISDPDRSNPTRARGERPLDTIRAFEYAATGDKHIREQLFNDRLPWDGRRYNPPPQSQAYSANGYNHDPSDAGAGPSDYAASVHGSAVAGPTIQLGNTAGDLYDEPYAPPKSKKDKKKKRGLFGKKRDDE